MARGDPEMRIRIPEDVKAWVRTVANRDDRSQTYVIGRILKEAMQAEEATAQK